MRRAFRIPTLLLGLLAAGSIAFLAREIMTSKAKAQGGAKGQGRFPPIEKKMRPILTKALAEKGMTYGSPVFLRAFKKERVVELWIEDRKTEEFSLFRTYKVCAASGDLGPKTKQGDLQVPEGFYFVKKGSFNPWSSYHLSFDIGYPNAYDRHHKRTGSLIMIHGNCVSLGCLAMTDRKIEEIYTLAHAALINGQPFFRVHIFPFRMTEEAMTDEGLEKHQKWMPFWENLKIGYDWFEKRKQPPDVNLDRTKGEYTFSE